MTVVIMQWISLAMWRAVRSKIQFSAYFGLLLALTLVSITTAQTSLSLTDDSAMAGSSLAEGPPPSVIREAAATTYRLADALPPAAWTCEPPDECYLPWKLFPAGPDGWELTGWVAAGATTNPDNPRNPAEGVGNLPTTFNYRNDNVMLNQLYAVLAREADNGGCGWAWGGRVDLLYGEDYLFAQAAGLETHDDFANHWNGAENGGGIGGVGRMGLALPQAYVELARDNLRLKLGHFYTLAGYERVQAPANFFYSHAFAHQYGEPFTHTGALATWTPHQLWTVSCGVVNGWDKFDAESDRPAVLAGATYRPAHQRYSISFSVVSGDEDGTLPPFDGNLTLYSLVFEWQINECWKSVLAHDLGVQQNGGGAGQDAEWYSVYQYLFRELYETCRLGTRFGWFQDDDGTRVFPGIPGHHWEATAGLNWSPSTNVTLRPEIRWNSFDAHSGIPAGIGPYSGNGVPGVFGNLFNLDHQVLFACDLIVAW